MGTTLSILHVFTKIWCGSCWESFLTYIPTVLNHRCSLTKIPANLSFLILKKLFSKTLKSLSWNWAFTKKPSLLKQSITESCFALFVGMNNQRKADCLQVLLSPGGDSTTSSVRFKLFNWVQSSGVIFDWNENRHPVCSSLHEPLWIYNYRCQ